MRWQKHTFQFKQPSGTSRGVLKTKNSWFLIDDEDSAQPYVGECSIIEGLSPDPLNEIETKLDELCNSQDPSMVDLSSFPAIEFALHSMKAIQTKSSIDFEYGSAGIPINGLVWMGEPNFMKKQVREKVDAGFECVKIKIGALDFETELNLLRWLRSEFSKEKVELRVDANGAFSPNDALEKLKRLSAFDIHSIEQPIATKQWTEMAELCEVSPIDIALDEELIGLSQSELIRMMDEINPQYIILKPSFLGAIEKSQNVIELANHRDIGWWITSALESNIGLHAIAQFAASKNVSMPQGLGTGGLFTNNFDSPLYIQGQFLFKHPKDKWNLDPLKK